MALTVGNMLVRAVGEELPVIRATSNHLAVNYPFMAESGIFDPRTQSKIIGLPMGYAGEGRSGGIFFDDQFEQFRAKLIENSNRIVLGMIGNRKSSGVKAEIFLGAQVGYNHMVTDVKGEYDKLAAAIPGSIVLRFGPNSKYSVNMLDPDIDEDTQLAGISAMAVNGMGRGVVELDVIQNGLLTACIESVKAGASHAGRVALLPDLVEIIFEPDELVLDRMHRTKPEVRDMGYKLAMALQRYTTGNLRGISSAPTTPGLFSSPTPLLVLNVEAYANNPQVAAGMVTLLNFFTQSEWGRKNPSLRIHKIIHDEAWELMVSPGFLESVRRSFKLGGTWGIGNTLIAHHLTNLERSGNSEAVQDLNADSQTKVIYKQERDEVEASANKLHLTSSEVRRLPKLPAGSALYKFGEDPGIEVEVTVTGLSRIRPIVETREKLTGQAA